MIDRAIDKSKPVFTAGARVVTIHKQPGHTGMVLEVFVQLPLLNEPSSGVDLVGPWYRVRFDQPFRGDRVLWGQSELAAQT
jgi:hypothetical protein